MYTFSSWPRPSMRLCLIKASGDGCYTVAQAMCVFIGRYCHMATHNGGSYLWLWFYGTPLGTWWVLSLRRLVSFSPSNYSCIISSTIFSPLFSVSWCEVPVSWALGLLHGSYLLVVQFSRLSSSPFTSSFLCFTFWEIFLSSFIPSNAFLNFCYYILILKSFNTSF